MTTLQMERELLEQWHALPDEKRHEALDFIQFLHAKTAILTADENPVM
jgi:hypothetical protein